MEMVQMVNDSTQPCMSSQTLMVQSRRLRTNGSIKAGQASPMFPSFAKKRGSAFENPEPSSPKVTCIGQVW
nr:DNA ligase 1-like isoform X1 [Ipomoea batatas]